MFAGANNSRGGEFADDGILTAQEISYLQLRGTKLVTLSTCESGIGTISGGDGLIGLQRAFQVAGARSVVASNWRVNDKITRLLMERFYRNFMTKRMSKLDALRDAQLWILKNPSILGDMTTRGKVLPRQKLTISPKTGSTKRTHPFLWAPFVLSGDWR